MIFFCRGGAVNINRFFWLRQSRGLAVLFTVGRRTWPKPEAADSQRVSGEHAAGVFVLPAFLLTAVCYVYRAVSVQADGIGFLGGKWSPGAKFYIWSGVLGF